MKQDIKQKWLAALRSGEFGQLHKLTCDEGSTTQTSKNFCALGLLAHVSGGDYTNEDAYDLSKVEELYAATGLNDPAVEAITRMNDRERASFEEIANYVEKTL